MTEPIYLTIITTIVLMITFYVGRIIGQHDVLNSLLSRIENLEDDS